MWKDTLLLSLNVFLAKSKCQLGSIIFERKQTCLQSLLKYIKKDSDKSRSTDLTSKIKKVRALEMSFRGIQCFFLYIGEHFTGANLTNRFKGKIPAVKKSTDCAFRSQKVKCPHSALVPA